jgi:hypothetical protein
MKPGDLVRHVYDVDRGFNTVGLVLRIGDQREYPGHALIQWPGIASKNWHHLYHLEKVCETGRSD